KVNQDGSLATRMRAIGRTSSARVKAVVVADIGRRALGLAAPGTTFVVVTPKPPSRAVKGAKASHALRRTPVGTRVSLVVGIGPRGVLRAKTLKEIGRATLGDYVPLSGTVTAVDAGRRTVTLTSQSGAFRMRFVLHVAESANLASFVLGHRLSLSAALDAGGTFLSVGTAAATAEQTLPPSLAHPPAPPPPPPARRPPRRRPRRPPRPRRRSPRTRVRSPRRPSTASSPSGRARARAARFSAASTCPSDTACCGSATRSPRTTTTPARTSTA